MKVGRDFGITFGGNPELRKAQGDQQIEETMRDYRDVDLIIVIMPTKSSH